MKRYKNCFESVEIETFVGHMDKNSVMVGERKKLMVLHQCGNDKDALIGQLKTMINGLETDFDAFAG